MELQLIYRSSKGGRDDGQIWRAYRYLEKSGGAETRNEKVLDETESQELANQVHSLWDPSWN